ncbi:PREDICTED: cytochrome P450 705A20-like [Camelina sativa]|uniref:Cytochrome P450 705A20-like n=1 Tax=Camelina sativa TaxID=90675 RepID=A0ABM0YJ65_CAMSA|nr:PREDICTED: cytochrome P450 705A20-like [Camelina sativa]
MEVSLLFGPETFSGAPFGDYYNRAVALEQFYVNLLDKARKNESIDIHKETSKLNNNNVCKMLMGRTCSEENGEAGRVRDSVNKISGLLRKILLANMLREPLKKLRISLFEKEITSASNEFNELLERNLLEHEERPKDQQQAMDRRLISSLSRRKCRELFLAGTDTSSQTIQWAMAEIINKPSIFERLRQETNLPRLLYLQAVVKETLRLHQPAPLLIRKFEERCKVGGFCIPENTTLVVNIYALMRDQNYWEDPDEFKPKRFLVSGREEEGERALTFLPFGSGRRGCPAVNTGYIFVGNAFGVMVQCFDWRIKGYKVVNLQDTVAGMTLTMAHPPSFTPLPRIDPLNLNL